jgi:hypothetical protein
MSDVMPYTTITVEEYTHMANVILALREQIQRSREFLEQSKTTEALEELKKESE